MKVGAPDILNASILIVDDQESNVSLLEQLLSEAGYACVASTMNPQDVCALHPKNRYDLIRSHAPGASGHRGRVIALIDDPGVDAGASWSTSDAWRPYPPSEARPRKLPTGRRARSSPSPTTQSQCSAAVNQRETVAICQPREKRRIEFPIVRSDACC